MIYSRNISKTTLFKLTCHWYATMRKDSKWIHDEFTMIPDNSVDKLYIIFNDITGKSYCVASSRDSLRHETLQTIFVMFEYSQSLIHKI